MSSESNTKNDERWSGPRKRLTFIAIALLIFSSIYTGKMIWKKLTYIPVTAKILDVKKHVTLTPEKTTSYQVTLKYSDSSGKDHIKTSSYRASWLNFDRGEKVPLLLDPKNSQVYSFNTFTPTWGFCLILFSITGFSFWISRAM